MKRVLGIILLIGGIILGFYIGIWKCFVLGIVGIIDAIRSPEAITSMQLAISITKVLFAGFFGWAMGIIPAAIGFYFIVED